MDLSPSLDQDVACDVNVGRAAWCMNASARSFDTSRSRQRNAFDTLNTSISTMWKRFHIKRLGADVRPVNLLLTIHSLVGALIADDPTILISTFCSHPMHAADQ
jgi:hypothetical protein